VFLFAARTILPDLFAKPKLKDVNAVPEEMSYNCHRNAVRFVRAKFRIAERCLLKTSAGTMK
jgi:hypothetical protein